jgi:hypothetical protein
LEEVKDLIEDKYIILKNAEDRGDNIKAKRIAGEIELLKKI